MTKPLTIYGLKTCDTCRKALKQLSDAGISVDFRDLRNDPLSDSQTAEILRSFGTKTINRASTTWRQLSEADRLIGAPELLAAHPALFKRPLIFDGTTWFQGWTPATQNALLG